MRLFSKNIFSGQKDIPTYSHREVVVKIEMKASINLQILPNPGIIQTLKSVLPCKGT